MNIERRTKYSKQGRTSVKTDNKININFDIISLNLMCSYILSESRNVRTSHLINMRNLFDMIDMTLYENDIERVKRIKFIRKGLEAKLIEKIHNPNMVIKYINGGIMDDSIIDINNFSAMSNDEIQWINNTVSESLNYSFIFNDAYRALDVFTRFTTCDYQSRGSIVREIEALITEMQTKFRRNKVESSTEVMFSLRQGVFEEVVTDFHSQLSNPANRLLCGMQGLNEMTAGGFESGRVYMLFGLPGEGKSTTLLNLAYQLKKYNKTYKPKDPTKIPCVVLLTQENTVRETVERLFNISSTPDDIVNFSAEEVISILRTEGELYLTDESPVDIIIKYKADNSVDTGYLYTLTEDLEDEGYEVICLLQDYIKRIRPVNRSGDIRLDLGTIVNEFKIFAAIKDIPVISASQLNRDATKHIDEGRKTNKADLLRLLGRSNIGESMLMLENIDCGFMIAPEYDQSGAKFMGMQRIKMRYKASNREHIYQPYMPGNSIKLIEDFASAIPVFRNSMKNDNEDTMIFNTGLKQSQYHTNTIRDLDTDMKFRVNDDDHSFFAHANVVNFDNANNNIPSNLINPIQFYNRAI